MKLQISGETATLSKGDKTVVINKDDHVLITTWYFEKLFTIPDLRPMQGKTLDFVSGVLVFGYDLVTSPLAVLEIQDAIMGYNLMRPARSGDVVLDCGSCHGLYAFYISKTVGKTGKVYCFEPDPENFKILARNVQKNKSGNICPIQAGIWSQSTTLEFLSQNIGSCVSRGAKAPNTIKVKVFSLADFFKEQNLSKIDFVKMDIEGAEVEVLGSSREFIVKTLPAFAIASYHPWGKGKTATYVEDYFSKLPAYECITANPPHLTTYAWPKATDANISRITK
ncbi:MAG: FkbM family methyltransferase [Candidatus Micrarchaeota archaeon]|nr:FkbM family methyltransferase [Candidatus Micrarchaeota archaeon]